LSRHTKAIDAMKRLEADVSAETDEPLGGRRIAALP
jgi:hypothetical protein